MRDLEARAKEAEERLELIIKMLRDNANPSKIAEVLAQHYFKLARECMEGYTPRPDLRDYWFKFNKAYIALASKCRKLEDAQ